MRKLGFKLFFSAVMAVCMTSCDSCGGGGSDSDLCDHVKVSAASFKFALEKSPKSIIIDYRSEEDFAKGHIPGAVSLPVTVKDLDGVKGNCPYVKRVLEICGVGTEIFVYGADSGWGINGNAVPGQLACKFGEDKVTLLEGGINAWTKAGYPTE